MEICQRARAHFLYVIARLGWEIENEEQVAMSNGRSTMQRSVACILSKFIRSGDVATVHVICRVAASDPARRPEDLELVLYSQPPENCPCMAVAAKYGYYNPVVLRHYQYVCNYMSYSAVRTIFLKGSPELMNVVIRHNFYTHVMVTFSCNIVAMVDLFLEIMPDDDGELAKFREVAHGDYPSVTREEFQKTIFYTKLNQYLASKSMPTVS